MSWNNISSVITKTFWGSTPCTLLFLWLVNFSAKMLMIVFGFFFFLKNSIIKSTLCQYVEPALRACYIFKPVVQYVLYFIDWNVLRLMSCIKSGTISDVQTNAPFMWDVYWKHWFEVGHQTGLNPSLTILTGWTRGIRCRMWTFRECKWHDNVFFFFFAQIGASVKRRFPEFAMTVIAKT